MHLCLNLATYSVAFAITRFQPNWTPVGNFYQQKALFTNIIKTPNEGDIFWKNDVHPSSIIPENWKINVKDC